MVLLKVLTSPTIGHVTSVARFICHCEVEKQFQQFSISQYYPYVIPNLVLSGPRGYSFVSARVRLFLFFCVCVCAFVIFVYVVHVREQLPISDFIVLANWT